MTIIKTFMMPSINEINIIGMYIVYIQIHNLHYSYFIHNFKTHADDYNHLVSYSFLIFILKAI